jgi:hypothetical protein
VAIIAAAIQKTHLGKASSLFDEMAVNHCEGETVLGEVRAAPAYTNGREFKSKGINRR